MAKRLGEGSGPGGGGGRTVPKTHNVNPYDGEKLKGFLDRIRNKMDDMESEKGAFMSAQKRHREDIKTIFEQASNAGIPTKEFKLKVKDLELEARRDAIRAGLEPDQLTTFELLEQALGEFVGTPLGQSAIRRTGGKPKADEPEQEPEQQEDDPRPEFLKRQAAAREEQEKSEGEKIGERNGQALARGLKQLAENDPDLN